MSDKKSRLSYDPIFKVEDGELKDMTALESNVAKAIKIATNTIFMAYGFFLVSMFIASGIVEVNFGFIGVFILNDVVKTIYFIMRLVTAVMVAIFIIFILKAERKYEVTQWEGIGLLRAITFACIMIAIVVVDVTVIMDSSGNDWVMRFWKNGTILFEASALIDLCFVLPATILSIASLVVQLLKTGKQGSTELLYNSIDSQENRVFMDSTVKRMRCVDTDKGTICKVTSTLSSKEFMTG